MPLVEATDTIRGASRKCSEASRASLIRSCAAMLTAITEFQRPASMLASSLSRVIPALWITMSSRPWRAAAWSMIRWPASSRLMSSCRAVPWTSLATAARWSPAAGMSTSDERGAVAVQRAGDRGADAAGGAGHDGDLAGQRLLGVVGQLAGGGADGQELPVHERRAARQEEPQRPQGAGARGAGAVGEQDAVAGGAGAQLLGQRPQQPVHALPGRGRCRVRRRALRCGTR